MKNFTKLLLLFTACISANSLFARVNKLPVTESFKASLLLLNSDSSTNLLDGTLAQYSNSFSASVDYMDAIKLSNINETLGLLRNGTLLSIERRPIIVTNDTLFLNLTKTVQRNYQFQFTATLLNHPGMTGEFQDSYKGTSVTLDLNGTTTVNFSIDANVASQDANRFMIVFSPSGITPVTFSSIQAVQQNGDVALQWNVANEIDIKQYQVEKSTDGNIFSKVSAINTEGKSISSKYTWIDVNASTGNYFYRILSLGSNGESSYSQIVKVSIQKAASLSMSVYPNPIRNGIIGLKFNNLPSGIYTARLINSSGQEMTRRTINHVGGNTTENISFDQGINKGIYRVEITKPDNSKTALTVLYQ